MSKEQNRSIQGTAALAFTAVAARGASGSVAVVCSVLTTLVTAVGLGIEAGGSPWGFCRVITSPLNSCELSPVDI